MIIYSNLDFVQCARDLDYCAEPIICAKPITKLINNTSPIPLSIMPKPTITAEDVARALGIKPGSQEKQSKAKWNAAYEYAKHIVDEVRVCDIASENSDFVTWHKVLESLFRHVWVYLSKTNKELGTQKRASVRQSLHEYTQWTAKVGQGQTNNVLVHQKFKPPSPYDTLDDFHLFIFENLHKANLLNPTIEDQTGRGLGS